MPIRSTPMLLLAVVLAAAGVSRVAGQVADALQAPAVTAGGRLELDRQSEFSHIRIRRQGNVRSLIFVRDNGDEAYQSQVDLRRPYVLRYGYLRTLFASYLLQPPPKRVMIVGLGGGSMVHFLQKVEPKVAVEAVEIDPVVVEIAAKYFGCRPSENVEIVTDDGLKHLAAASEKSLDAIYMDAFLKPTADTDGTGAPLALRTREFYKQMQTKLAPHGVVAFNLNPHPQVEDDVAAIAAAFPQAYVFVLPRNEGLVVVASTDATRVATPELMRRARELDDSRRFLGMLNFREMVKRLRP